MCREGFSMASAQIQSYAQAHLLLKTILIGSNARILMGNREKVW